MKNGFFRGHGLGNDYLVFDRHELSFPLTPSRITAICDRNTGLGSDGILPHTCPIDDRRLRAQDLQSRRERGREVRQRPPHLRARPLRDRETTNTRFTVETKGGLVTIQLRLDGHREASSVTVDMGRATFEPAALPCRLDIPELIEQPITAVDESLNFTGVSVGNPHCIVFTPAGQSWSRDDLLRLGPILEHHPLFPKRTNVQLAAPTGPNELAILIWERVAGETQASRSSACAAASAAVRLGLMTSPVTVTMPRGELIVEVDDNFGLTMTGPVVEVAWGALSPSFVRDLC